ncbi:RHTO0S30e00166g2_1 [Rhodotorula toruloides]|uniref:RHTO0S30e00166g2_1 n=2 Tax=Rhodotorula toruloides TaxID=5286 RepID=A0A061BNV4_RHOTO|nr:RHTO0S30e00166g2_1 [Rhodotorula toruloides]
MGECQAHLKAVKSQVAANQEKLGKLSLTEPRIATTESRVEALEKQASQTTDPRRRPTSAAAAFPTPQPPPGPSHVDQQKTVDMQKAVDEVKGRVGQLEARVGVVDELEKKVADVQLKVDEVAQDVMKKRDADDMEIDDDSGSGEKLSVLEKRLEEVRDEWVKEVAAVKDDVEKVSSRKTVPPEHVPLVASLAHFAAAGQPDLSSEELANRLETGLRGWDAGLGSHKERIKELRSELAEYRQTSDKKFVDVSEVSEAYLPLASHIAAYLRRGQIRGRFPTPQEIGFPDDFRLDVPANGIDGSTVSRQTSPAQSQTRQPSAGVGTAATPSRVAQVQGSASPMHGGGSNGHRPSGSS